MQVLVLDQVILRLAKRQVTCEQTPFRSLYTVLHV